MGGSYLINRVGRVVPAQEGVDDAPYSYYQIPNLMLWIIEGRGRGAVQIWDGFRLRLQLRLRTNCASSGSGSASLLKAIGCACSGSVSENSNRAKLVRVSASKSLSSDSISSQLNIGTFLIHDTCTLTHPKNLATNYTGLHDDELSSMFGLGYDIIYS